MFKNRPIRISLILTAFIANPTYAQYGAAQNSMNSAFNSLSQVLKDLETTNDRNWIVKKNNNTQDYLDSLYSNKTVKDLLANQEDLERMRIGYGAQIDRDAVRSAFDDRLSSLMRRERSMETGR